MAAILYGILTFLLQQVVIKFVVYTVLFVFISAAVTFLQSYMFSGDGGIAAAFGGIGGGFTVLGQSLDVGPMVDYLLNYFLIPTWLQVLLAAYATRFLIRRIPFIN